MFLTYSGCTLEEQDKMLALAEQLSGFDQVILQKATATVAANTWLRSFGIMYVKE